MLFENKKFREFTYIYALISLILMIAVWGIFAVMYQHADREYLAFTARMMAEYDGMAGEVQYADNYELQKAEEVLKKSGYDTNGIYKMYSDVHEVYVKDRWIAEGILAAFLILVYGITAFYTKRIFARIHGMSYDVNRILETGQFDYKQIYEEGAIGRLDSSYHTLVHALKQSKEREAADKEFLRDTLQDISHQLKTPIASMTVFNDLLLSGKLNTKEEKIEILTENQKQLERMKWLVLAMLKMARLDADSVQFDIKENKLADTIEMALSKISHKVIEKNYIINNHCGKNVLLPHDADWLAEALGNLFVNAADHMEYGGTIDINVEGNEHYVRISIKDDGCGIPEAEIPHIFERFHKGSRNPNPNSVGIGLALAKAIINGQNGDITVRSEEGRYTEFIILFFK